MFQERDLYPLESLKELRLDYNKLTKFGSNIFHNIISLEILDISSNPINLLHGSTQEALGNLTHLKVGGHFINQWYNLKFYKQRKYSQ